MSDRLLAASGHVFLVELVTACTVFPVRRGGRRGDHRGRAGGVCGSHQGRAARAQSRVRREARGLSSPLFITREPGVE